MHVHDLRDSREDIERGRSRALRKEKIIKTQPILALLIFKVGIDIKS